MKTEKYCPRKRVYKNRPRSYYCKVNWRKYGITNKDGTPFTHDDYDIMFAFQDGSCAICQKHQSECRFALCVDHDHDSGTARGLLCRACNTRLAVLEDKDFVEKCRRYQE